MRVLVCLAATVAVAAAGLIGYPFNPLGYSYSYQSVVGHPVPSYATVSQPFGPTTYTTTFYGNPFLFNPSPFSPGYFPNTNVLFSHGVPGVVQILPLPPPEDGHAGGKGKKKPEGKSDKDDGDDKETKEETTENPKKEEESKSEAEDLSE